jgi:hypothetical protein
MSCSCRLIFMNMKVSKAEDFNPPSLQTTHSIALSRPSSSANKTNAPRFTPNTQINSRVPFPQDLGSRFHKFPNLIPPHQPTLKMRIPNLVPSLLALLISISSVTATALTYKLAANEKACFFTYVGEQNSKLAFYFAVRTFPPRVNYTQIVPGGGANTVSGTGPIRRLVRCRLSGHWSGG